MKKLAVFLCTIFFVFGITGMAGGTYIEEAKWNNSFEEAQNLDGAFSLDADPDIFEDTISPHASVYATIKNKKDIDYFSFTVSPEYMTGFFDIDHSSTVDTSMALFDSGHNLLAFNPDSALPPADLDPGSSTRLNDDGKPYVPDSFIGVYTFTAPDIYYLAVANYAYHVPAGPPGLTRPDGEWGGDSPLSDTIEMLSIKGPGDMRGAYTLHVSLSSPVPEPTTILLFGSGLIGLAGIRKRFRT